MAPRGKGRGKRQKKKKKWSLYPDLHDAVTTKLEESGILLAFNPADEEDCLKEYDTNIMGLFICRNNKCSNDGWSSKIIAVTIRLYEGSLYNARVYHQRCKGCMAPIKPRLDDDSYVERIVYRMRKWHSLQVEKQPYRTRKGPPHEKDLCEGCLAGHCQLGRRQDGC
ncbi:hypothetical protein CP533_1231 [Ophiocordyceps camponoti-saundersi (nom. inval.)]|nr:hypothetical protein CP533_1231 [Ophiocordyceps camponoti-saundersi (nom. inval.)]